MGKGLTKSEFFDMEEVERIRALDTNSDKKDETHKYLKPLSDFDIKELNEELNDTIQKREMLSEEKTALSTKIKNLNKFIIDSSDNITNEAIEVVETIWSVNNHHTGKTEFINKDGYIIKEKRFAEGQTMNIFRQTEQSDKKAM